MVTVSNPLWGWTSTPLSFSEGGKLNSAAKSSIRKGLIRRCGILAPGIKLYTLNPSPTIPGFAGRGAILSIAFFISLFLFMFLIFTGYLLYTALYLLPY